MLSLFRRFVALAIAASLALTLPGCTFLPWNSRSNPAAQPEASTDGFPWAGNVIEATATGSPPKDVQGEPQRSLMGRQAAKSAAIKQLKTQVERLHVSEDVNVGQLMKKTLALKYAIEQRLQQSAQIVSETRIAPDVYQTQVRLPLQQISDILADYYITPEGLPQMPEKKNDIPPVS